MFARLDSVPTSLEKVLVMAGGRFDSWGAIMGGRLKDAKIVRESRRANNAYEILGIAATGDEGGPPNILANCESLYTHRDMLTDEVARNFVVPDVIVEAGFAETVDKAVSTVLAVAYVPEYKARMRRKGLEVRKAWGLVRTGRSARLKHDENDAPVAAFSTIDLALSDRDTQGGGHGVKIVPINDRYDGCYQG